MLVVSPKVRIDLFRFILKKHKKMALHFRRLIYKYKASIEQLLPNHPHDYPDYSKYAKDLKLYLQLVCNLR